MSHIRLHRHGLVALWLVVSLAVLPSLALGADASPEPEAVTEGTTEEAAAQPEPSPAVAWDPTTLSLRTDLFAEGFDAPVYLADDGAPASCLYVVERGGKVRIVEADGFPRVRPFLDISTKVATGAEQGLHSIAFHPKFRQNGRFFVHYNGLPDGNTVIEEYRGKPCKSASGKPVRTVLNETQPYPNNNGGWIGFGPDGMLYVALGDGGGTSPGDPDGLGQTKSTPLAKVLRVNINKGKTFVVPKDNPYAVKKRGFHPATWAWGLRDPRRASFDRKTGDLWIGEVGQRIEEVDRVPAGVSALNFGWSQVEGESTCHPNVPDCEPGSFEPPTHFYDKAPPHRAITGGYVYRGAANPDLRGIYLFSDFASGFIWGIDADAVAAGQPAVAHQLLDAPHGYVSFGEDDQGELYVISFDGRVYRIGTEAA